MECPAESYIHLFSQSFPKQKGMLPWEITSQLPEILEDLIGQLTDSYVIEQGVAIHKSAIVEPGAILKGPLLVQEGCFIGAHAYLRGGVFLGKGSTVGPGCEIKSSIIMQDSALAHFNFIGDSIIGNRVNFEAGALIANHYNERSDKQISVLIKAEILKTKAHKFGALVGDDAKIGANAVLSPGTILEKKSIIGRLELVEQTLP